MSGKLIVHGFNVNLAFGGKPVKIIIDGKEAGSVSKFETTIIDIEKDCSLKVKYGLNTSKPTSIANGMLTEVQIVAATDRLRADILRCEPYKGAAEADEKLMSEIRNTLTACKSGILSLGVAVEKFCELQQGIVEWTIAIEEEINSINEEFNVIAEKEDARAQKELAAIKEASEHRMRCNVCGHIFCYTDEDVKKNATNATMGAISAIGGLASALGGGTIFHTHHLSGQADRYSDKVVDYNRCPACNSTNITEMKKGEVAQPQSNTTAPAVSPVEEIKKYKELLDMGIITQEEFDTKKKQLLGL
ncbi:MAG: SHOCT domain-containing protein [Firmicutes bacterium]|nr:SHOCT domain-containing protein [Bacillota bacterium]